MSGIFLELRPGAPGPSRVAATRGGSPSDGARRARGEVFEQFQVLPGPRRGAARVGTAALVGAALALAACVATRGPRVVHAEAPSKAERYCAWFGDSDGEILYFGVSAFWSAFRAAGDPEADLAAPGPQWIGRFDLGSERFLPPLDLGAPDSAGGVWDVLAVGDRIYFTDYFGSSGWVSRDGGRVVRFPQLGGGLNEIARGPGGALLVTRYGDAGHGGGSVLVVGPDGELLAEHALESAPGSFVAPKSVAFDPVRQEIWVNADLLAEPGGEVLGRETRVLGRGGAERARFARPEVQFMTFGADGTGWFAEADGPFLSLRIRPPDRASSPVLTGRRVPLDDAFAGELDFVQDVKLGGDGVALVTRWSGVVHRVTRDGDVRTLRLPGEPGDLAYTGVLHGERVCATRCGDVEVVCRDTAE